MTALKKRPGRGGRVAVYLDGRAAFDLPPALAAGLAVGQSLGPTELERLLSQAAEEAAVQRGLRLLQVRPRSEHELRQRLVRAGVPEAAQARALERLRQAGLLDDPAFARAWVEDRQTFKPRARRALLAELRAKGLAAEDIEAALAGVDDDQAAERAARKIAARLRGAGPQDFERRLGAWLARRGFGYETIKPLVRRLWREAGGADGDVER